MKTAERTAVLNGFGRSLGDSLIGLQALHALQALGRMGRPVLFREDFGNPMVRQIYPLAADFADVAPMADFDGSGFDRVIDIRDFAFDPGFRGVAMIDFFLDRLGADPGGVPAALKRNAWLAPRVADAPLAGLPDRYVLVCPGASMPMRDIPGDIHAQILAILRHTQTLPVVSQGACRPGEAVPVGPQASIGALCGLVRHAAAIVSTDTGMVHLADAFDVPCLAFFTTHRPEWRMRDYPRCTAVRLPVEGLPEALEFCRGDADLEAVARGWAAGRAAIAGQIADFLAANALPA